MKKMWKFLVNNIILIIFIVLLFYYLFACSLNMYTDPSYKCLGASIIIIFAYYLIYNFFIKLQNKSERKVKIFIFIFSLICYFLWNLWSQTKPVSDYKVLIDGANQILNGNFSEWSFDKTNYFYWWNFQTGFSLFLAGIMSIVGKSLIALKIVEAIILAVSNLLVYEIGKIICDKKVALLSTLIYTTFFFMIGGSSIINNQHSSFLFVLTAIYLFLKSDKWYNNILVGILFAIGYILRQTVMVSIVSLIIYVIWGLFKNNFKSLKKSLVIIILILLSYTVTINGFDYVMQKTRMVPNSAIKGNCPYFKFILGVQWQNMYGPGTLDDLEYYEFDYETYNKDAKDYIISKYKNHFMDEVKIFISEKMERFAGLPDSQIDFAGDKAKKYEGGKMLKYYGYAEYLCVIFMSLSSTIILYKNKNAKRKFFHNDFYNYFIISFILLFCAYLFIEVQSRYRYEQYVVLAIMSSPSLLICFKYIDKIVNKVKQKIDFYIQSKEI